LSWVLIQNLGPSLYSTSIDRVTDGVNGVQLPAPHRYSYLVCVIAVVVA
jgi:hypothetical protein